MFPRVCTAPPESPAANVICQWREKSSICRRNNVPLFRQSALLMIPRRNAPFSSTSASQTPAAIHSAQKERNSGFIARASRPPRQRSSLPAWSSVVQLTVCLMVTIDFIHKCRNRRICCHPCHRARAMMAIERLFSRADKAPTSSASWRHLRYQPAV